MHGGWDYCYDPNYPYTDFCINGVTFEDLNTKFPEYLQNNGFKSVYGELISKSTGNVKCKDDEDEAKFQVFLCDEKSGDSYFDENSGTWYFPSLWPTPQDFKDMLRKRFTELFPAPVDDDVLENAVNNVYNNKVNYESQYNQAIWYIKIVNGISAGKAQYSCPQRQSQETKTHMTYDCFSKGADPQLEFSYNSPFVDDYDEFFNGLPKIVKDQNSFGFILNGEIGEGANFPKYLMPGEVTKISLQKNCYEATIIFDSSDFHLKESLPIISGIGALPESCKKTLRCSIHWCGDDSSFTMEAQSKKAFKFRIESHQMGLDAVEGFSFKGSSPFSQSLPTPYCLQKEITQLNCKTSITWSAPLVEAPKSAYLSRTSIILSQNADVTRTETCFKFPFKWSFDNWLDKRDIVGGDYAVSEYFKQSFTPPAEIFERSSVTLLDLAHDVGGGLAIYKDLNTNKFIAQVCNPKVNYHDDTDPNMNFYMNINGEGEISRPKAVGISDSGTVVVIYNGGDEFFVYSFDQVKANWSHSATVERSPGLTCRIALSTHGHFFAILTGSNVYLYQKALHGSNYETRAFDNPDVIGPRLDALPVDSEYNHVSIYASESGLVSLQVRDESSDARLTREVSIFVIPFYMDFVIVSLLNDCFPYFLIAAFHLY